MVAGLDVRRAAEHLEPADLGPEADRVRVERVAGAGGLDRRSCLARASRRVGVASGGTGVTAACAAAS